MAQPGGQQPDRRRPRPQRSGGQPSRGGTGGRGSSRGGSSSRSGSRGRDTNRSSGRGGPASRSGGGQKRQDRGRDSGSHPPNKARRRDLEGAAANLPNWVVESLARVTPDKRVPAALTALGEASEAFAEGAYQRALRKAEKAKDLAPRDTTIRELLGLSAYRLGDWQKALAELRAFRRMAGETTHLPIEMDSLRAMGRENDVESAWDTLRQRGGKPAVMKEGAVVFASYLIDRGDLAGAWHIVGPKKLDKDPFPEDLRTWYIAARVAALQGDAETAGRLRNAILEHDPAFPGIDELESLIAHS